MVNPGVSFDGHVPGWEVLVGVCRVLGRTGDGAALVARIGQILFMVVVLKYMRYAYIGGCVVKYALRIIPDCDELKMACNQLTPL